MRKLFKRQQPRGVNGCHVTEAQDQVVVFETLRMNMRAASMMPNSTAIVRSAKTVRPNVTVGCQTIAIAQKLGMDEIGPRNGAFFNGTLDRDVL